MELKHLTEPDGHTKEFDLDAKILAAQRKARAYNIMFKGLSRVPIVRAASSNRCSTCLGYKITSYRAVIKDDPDHYTYFIAPCASCDNYNYVLFVKAYSLIRVGFNPPRREFYPPDVPPWRQEFSYPPIIRRSS